MSWTSLKRIGGVAAVLAIGLPLVSGCQSPPRSSQPSAPAPVVEEEPPQEAPQPQAAPAPAPASPEPSNAGEAEAVTPPPDLPPKLPDYLRVLKRFDPRKPSDVQFNLAAPRRLTIETRNVRRLWIDRDRLPLDLKRSIILRLDGQGIEWTPGSTTREFERSVNGAWSPAKEGTP